MFKVKEYVNASDIWPGAENFVDKGRVYGYVRGYNIEVRKPDGTTFWESACWFPEEPEQYYNSGYYEWHFEDTGYEPTGRICFRGYGIERYDFEAKVHYIERVMEDSFNG